MLLEFKSRSERVNVGNRSNEIGVVINLDWVNTPKGERKLGVRHTEEHDLRDKGVPGELARQRNDWICANCAH